MKQPILSTVFFALVVGIAIAAAGAARAADEVGRVTAVAGDATAQQPGGSPRALACGDPVFAGDTLHTGRDSHVGVQLDDVAAHVDANSQVELGRTAQGMPAVRLEAGKVRVIDPRDAGEPAELAVLDTDARVRGNDAEGYIFTEKVGPYAMLCEWDSPLPVTRGKEAKTAEPGHCVIAKPKEPLYSANAHDTRIPALAQACGPAPDLAALSSPLHHLSPADVAAPGPMPGSNIAGFGNVNPAAALAPTYTSCQLTGSCSQPIPIVVHEPAPVGHCGPGVVCP